MKELTLLQEAIAQALVKIGERASPYSDSILLKEIRRANGIVNKKTSTVRLADVEKAILELNERGEGAWSIRLDSVNNLLIKKVDSIYLLDGEDKSRRLRSEKSMSLLTEKDLLEARKGKASKR